MVLLLSLLSLLSPLSLAASTRSCSDSVGSIPR
jgi:hypothetical protein